MKKSCVYCGKIHEKSYKCPCMQSIRNRRSKSDEFRGSAEWKYKRREIRERDLNLCILCRLGLYCSDDRFLYNTEVEAHHITPLIEDWSKRLDNDNLISLCRYHHELAEKGLIPRQKLRDLIPKSNLNTAPAYLI